MHQNHSQSWTGNGHCYLNQQQQPHNTVESLKQQRKQLKYDQSLLKRKYHYHRDRLIEIVGLKHCKDR